MRVSVVIPALNEERHLGQLLSAIQQQSRRPDEVIVVDAGSRDATVRIAKHSPRSSSVAGVKAGAYARPRIFIHHNM